MPEVNRQTKIYDPKTLDFRHFRGVQRITNFSNIYKWTRLLGAGSFGEVHEAINLKANILCAVKVMKKKKIYGRKALADQVKKELGVLQRLDHPHIVHVLELLTDERNMYMVMELIEHGNLMEVH